MSSVLYQYKSATFNQAYLEVRVMKNKSRTFSNKMKQNTIYDIYATTLKCCVFMNGQLSFGNLDSPLPFLSSRLMISLTTFVRSRVESVFMCNSRFIFYSFATIKLFLQNHFFTSRFIKTIYQLRYLNYHLSFKRHDKTLKILANLNRIML